MKKKIWNILGYMALSLMVLTACRNGVADVPDVPDLPMETMRLLIAAPEKMTSRAPGDPGSGVDEAEDWDRMAVILAEPVADLTAVTVTTTTFAIAFRRIRAEMRQRAKQ